ncbi:cation-translocating P-type ATPase [Brachybacterium sp. J144]|uniref:heavy metal translocating P-type ATPase n=1 Tax=Brachybacterium sp. J144 TaxID=3116487 RepID=UPI002E76735A|nr:cation-translocating P-type ATPase [Brachybacterium sp. J144]MEE1651850.1 cation-translocating P-type ATPase [Brachybacterium sp. J144]
MTALQHWWRGPWSTPLLAGALIVLAALLSLGAGENPFGAGHGELGLHLDRPLLLLASDALMVLAALVAGAPILIAAVRALRVRTIGIDLLVTIAAVGALVIGEYWEAAAVTFLFAIGHALEAGTMNRTRSALAELVAAAPDIAVVLRDGQQVEVPAAEVRLGETVLVKNGAKVPVDGTVLAGTGAIDEAAITGESIPAAKGTEDAVFAGTVSAGGFLQVRATGVGADTTLARIIHRVEEAQDAKARTQTFLERFSTWYTPAVIVLALAAGLVTGDVVLALTLLVIGCPGALVISIPVAIVAGIGRGAKDGLLIKGGEFLEASARVDAVALDKTGTLTEGRPHLTDVTVLDPDLDRTAVLRWAARAEAGSEHPLARPVLEGAATEGVVPGSLPEHTEPVPGQGIVATIEGRRVAVGNLPLLEREGILVPAGVHEEVARLAALGRTPMAVALDGTVIGVLGVADRLRPEAADLITRLHREGVDRVLMLTGDDPRVARAVAAQVGIDEVRAGLLPEDKLAAITALQREGRTVAMVGDGVNDAPALATADIGVAMGAAGSGVAIETADIALMQDDLLRLPEALGLARRTVRVMRQNIVLAVATVALLLAGVFAGGVTMAIGMLVHEASVLLVIANAMRLLRRRRPEGSTPPVDDSPSEPRTAAEPRSAGTAAVA